VLGINRTLEDFRHQSFHHVEHGGLGVVSSAKAQDFDRPVDGPLHIVVEIFRDRRDIPVGIGLEEGLDHGARRWLGHGNWSPATGFR
jgi:hypothetical protein